MCLKVRNIPDEHEVMYTCALVPSNDSREPMELIRRNLRTVMVKIELKMAGSSVQVDEHEMVSQTSGEEYIHFWSYTLRLVLIVGS